MMLMIIDDNDDFDDSHFRIDCDNAIVYCFLMMIDDDQYDTSNDEFDLIIIVIIAMMINDLNYDCHDHDVAIFIVR